ncbi:AraC family transcriptional regulator [Endozoicomonas ascidiicola]|uniref:AraC family transcriptional regulator n=1 Tax=Endozoicomonas ascidiicola TaxID=1698521 RepID=UPI0008303BBE|nr:AraC family transcriptional regulator [Endozoicomonas ascidiicola]
MLAKSQNYYRTTHTPTEHYFEKTPFCAQDIILYHCGEHVRSTASHTANPKDHFLLHVVYDGGGTLQLDNASHQQTIDVQSGDVFLIRPDTHARYQGDKNTPWSYCWIGIQGQLAESILNHAGFDNHQSVVHYSDAHQNKLIDSLKTLMKATAQERHNPLSLLSEVYRFLGLMQQNQPEHNPVPVSPQRSHYYLEHAHQYISKHYDQKVALDDIACNIGISRKHLSSLFREKYGQSLKSYLTTFRMRRACELLRQQPPISVEVVACRVGYDDVHGFSRMFRKYMTLSPTQYRDNSKCMTSICSSVLR